MHVSTSLIKNMDILLQYCSFAKYIKWSFCNTQNYRSYKNHNIGDGPLFLEGWGWVGFGNFLGHEIFSHFQVVHVFLVGKSLCKNYFKKSNTRPGEQKVHALLFSLCVPLHNFCCFGSTGILGENCSNLPGPFLIKIIVFLFNTRKMKFTK